jgi:fatty acid desaturase
MPAVARADPKEVFTDAEWARLSRRSPWRGLALAASAWAVIAAAAAMVVVWPNPVTYVAAVMLIGARQLGLAILSHDAAHGALHPDPRVNDWVADWLCDAAIGGSLKRYRPYHLAHHRYTEQPEDPDLGLSAPFPIDRASLARKIVRDLTGQTFFKQRVAPMLARLSGRKRKPPRIADRPGVRFWAVNGAAFAALTAAGLWWVWPALWIVPMATWLPLVTRLRSIAEHAVVGSTDDPFTHARTTRANPLERLLIAPFNVHYHCEHHAFMHLPCYRLPEVHRRLVERGYAPRMRIASGYGEVLAMAAGRRPAPAAA